MTDHEDSTGILDEETLRAALRPERVEAKSFRKGVGRRIAELEAQRGARRARLHAAPERLRWVASILPPGIIPGAAPAAGLVGKKLTVKAVPGLLALPAVSVAMVLATAFGAFFALSRQRPEKNDGKSDGSSDGSGDDKRTVSQVKADWWRRNRVATLVTFALLALLAYFQHPETVVVLVLASVAATTFLLGELARAGLADRRRVGRALAQLLSSIGLQWYFLRYFLPQDPSGMGPTVGPGLLLVGAIFCLFLSGSITWTHVRARLAHPVPMRYPDALTIWCLRIITWPLALFATVIVVLVCLQSTLQLVPHQPSRARLLRWAEGFDVATENPDEWLAFERTVLHLLRDGGEAPGLGSVRERLASHLGEVLERPWAKFPALRFDLIDHVELARRIGSDSKLLTDDGPLLHLSSAEMADVYGLATLGRLSRPERDAVADRIALTRPDLDRIGTLGQMRRKAELLDFLGHAELAELQRDDVRELLVGCWRGTHGPSFVAACFAPSSQIAAIDVTRFQSGAMHWVEVSSTQAAIELMARYGVPQGIDLVRVRRALVGAARPQPIGRIVGLADARQLAEVALLQLDSLAPEVRPGLWARLVDRRVALATLLLCVFSIVATLRAPRSEVSA